MGLLGHGLDAGDGNQTVDLLARNLPPISLGDLSVVGRLKSAPARPRSALPPQRARRVHPHSRPNKQASLNLTSVETHAPHARARPITAAESLQAVTWGGAGGSRTSSVACTLQLSSNCLQPPSPSPLFFLGPHYTPPAPVNTLGFQPPRERLVEKRYHARDIGTALQNCAPSAATQQQHTAPSTAPHADAWHSASSPSTLPFCLANPRFRLRHRARPPSPSRDRTQTTTTLCHTPRGTSLALPPLE